MALESGLYAKLAGERVIVWPKPDKNGTGPVIWVDQYDYQGRAIGREKARDNQGNEVREYPAPEGFQDLPNSDRKACWVYHEDGQIWRDKNGEAVNLLPGQAVVFHADKSVTILTDEWEQFVYGESRQKVSEDLG